MDDQAKDLLRESELFSKLDKKALQKLYFDYCDVIGFLEDSLKVDHKVGVDSYINSFISQMVSMRDLVENEIKKKRG